MPTKLNDSFIEGNTPVEIITGINTLSNYMLAHAILISLWLIIFFLLYQRERNAMGSVFFASFLVTILSVLFLGMGWLPLTTLKICIALTLITGFMNWMVNH